MSDQSRPAAAASAPVARRRAGGGRGPRRYSAQRPSERSRTSDPQRLAAYTVLRAVADGAYANLELPRILRDKHIHGRDAAFATELVYGTIRWQGLYDPSSPRPPAGPRRRSTPRSSTCCAWAPTSCSGCGSPPHAAADQTVGLAARSTAPARRASSTPSCGGSASARWRSGVDAVVPADATPSTRLSIEHHPPRVGRQRAARRPARPRPRHRRDGRRRAGRPARADNAPPRVTSSPGPAWPTVDELDGADAEPSRSPRSVRCSRVATRAASPLSARAGPPCRTRARSSSPSRWRPCPSDEPGPGAVARPVRGARRQGGAPGSAGAGGRRRPHRQRGEPAPGRPRAPDAAPLDRPRPGRRAAASRCARPTGAGSARTSPRRYERVLVDAPCTGLGALRRRPEARWRRTPADLADLGRLQRALLASAIDAIAPGGVVAYATCSPHLAETQFVVSDVTKRRDDVELDRRPGVSRRRLGSAHRGLGQRADGAAVAARARHRRHVPRAAPQAGLTAAQPRLPGVPPGVRARSSRASRRAARAGSDRRGAGVAGFAGAAALTGVR